MLVVARVEAEVVVEVAAEVAEVEARIGLAIRLQSRTVHAKHLLLAFALIRLKRSRNSFQSRFGALN